MNLGGGLLFELENGKPKLILLDRGIEKNSVKLPCRPRVANILSLKQLSFAEEVKGVVCPAKQLTGRPKESKSKPGGVAASFTSKTASKVEKSTVDYSSKVVSKIKFDRHKHSIQAGSQRAGSKTIQPQAGGSRSSGKKGSKDTSAHGDTELDKGLVCLTNEQLQQFLKTAQTGSNGVQKEKNSTQGGGIDMEEQHRGGGEEDMKNREEAGSDPCSQEKDIRLSGCLFSWMEERQSDSKAADDSKKAQWKRELDEQMALKQKKHQKHCSASSRLQAEEETESLSSVQSSVSHRDQPAAIRSSLRLWGVNSVEEKLNDERREVQRRRWLEDLERQRQEATERKRREKALQSQREDFELWATHFDSLQRRPPVLQSATPSVQSTQSAPPPAPSNASERREWEPSSSLSLIWEAMSSCGAESVGGASVDTTSGYPAKASHLRSMTALLDPAQIEEREKRRLKQLEQQRDIEAQMEERRQRKEQEEARRRQEEEQEENRLALERERLERQYELERERLKVSTQSNQHPEKIDDDRYQEADPPSGTGHVKCLENEKKEASISSAPYKDTAVQTEESLSLPLRADRVQTPDASLQQKPSPSLPAASLNTSSRAGRTGKENICVEAAGREGGDLYKPFARTERSRKDKRRPEWNTQRPSRQFVPASERYPASLQKNRQASRLKRQAELLALQERTCQSRTEPPPPPQNQEHLLSNPTHSKSGLSGKVENVSRCPSISSAVSTDRHRVQSEHAPSCSNSPHPPPVLEFIPYVRTVEVFNLDPLEPAYTPPHIHTEPPPQSSVSSPHWESLHCPELQHSTHTHRQKEILKGLAQLRKGLLQKQRELETDLNPHMKHHDSKLLSTSATHHM